MHDEEKKVYDILAELRPEFDYVHSENFVEEGLLDSFDIVTLVSELEDTYDIIIDGLDIVPENFETVPAILETVRKNGGSI